MIALILVGAWLLCSAASYFVIRSAVCGKFRELWTRADRTRCLLYSLGGPAMLLISTVFWIFVTIKDDDHAPW